MKRLAIIAVACCMCDDSLLASELEVRGLESYCRKHQIFPLEDLVRYSTVEGVGPRVALRCISYSGFGVSDLCFFCYGESDWRFSFRRIESGSDVFDYRYLSVFDDRVQARVLGVLGQLREPAIWKVESFHETGAIVDDGLIRSISYFDEGKLRFYTFQGSSRDLIQNEEFSELNEIWLVLIKEVNRIIFEN